MNGLTLLLESFSELVAPVLQFIIWCFPFKIYRLHDGEKGIVLTFGKVRRKNAERNSGISICFAFEELIQVQAYGGYINLDEQAITTNDNKVVIINGAVEYVINCVELAMLKTEDIENLIHGICMSEIRDYGRSTTLGGILDSSKLTSQLQRRINKKVIRHGCSIEDIMLTDVRPHGITLICDTVKDLVDRM